METLSTFTACLVQPVIRWIYRRDEIRSNLDRYLNLVDGIARRFGGWSPLKLVAFPEFFLQGFTTRRDIDLAYYQKEILISLPGPETDALAAQARRHGIYILGCALEADPSFPECFFNCAFLISPDGELVHKYRKAIPAIHAEMAMSPHDLLERYMEVYGTGKSIVETIFPVTETAIGRVGTFICMDGHFPEVTRALALQGAELLIRPTAFPEPLVSAPNNIWELQNRLRAHENMAYVLAPNTGGQLTDELPGAFTPGDSMIVDYNGLVLARAPYPGETVVSAEINLEGLRGRRQDPRRNFLTQLRTELFDGLYRQPIYPANRYASVPLTQRSEVAARDTRDIVDLFVQRSIFARPRT